MNGIIKTMNGHYSIRSGDRSDKSYISSNGMPELEILTPTFVPGQRNNIILTNNERNGKRAGQFFSLDVTDVEEFIPAYDYGIPRKDTNQLLVAKANGGLSQSFNTKHSTYTLTPIPNHPDVMYLTGGQLENPLVVNKPLDNEVVKGGQMFLTLAKVPENGVDGGRTWHSSRVLSSYYSDGIHSYTESEMMPPDYDKTKDRSMIHSIEVETASGSKYELTAQPNGMMLLTGSRLGDMALEVYPPSHIPAKGEMLQLKYTNNPNNGRFANNNFKSSTLEGVYYDDVSGGNAISIPQQANAMDVYGLATAKFEITLPDIPGADAGSHMQTKMHDVCDRLCEHIGVASNPNAQSVHFTPSFKRDGQQAFQMYVTGIPLPYHDSYGVSPELMTTIREELNDIGYADSTQQISYIGTMTAKEMESANNALSSRALGLDKQSMLQSSMRAIQSNQPRAVLNERYAPSELSAPNNTYQF